MSLLLKKSGAQSHSRPALKKKHGAHAESTAWTPLMEDRRSNAGVDPDGRRDVDRAKELREDDDGGPDA